ncbi:MAG: protein kinase family protein, partial [Planctomycetota bacterium]
LDAEGLRHGNLEPSAVALPGGGQVLLGLRRVAPADLVTRDVRYVAPEEARGQDGNLSSDLFTIGLLLLEALLGRPPFEGDADAIRAQRAAGEVPDVKSILKGVLPQTVTLVARLMAPHPADRPSTVAEVIAQLRQLQGAFTATESLEGSFDAPMAAMPVGEAPVPAAPVIPVAGAAPPAAPVAPAAPAAPAAPKLKSKRTHARVILPRRGVELIHECLDPVTFVGRDEAGLLVARGANFDGALAQVELGQTVDWLYATGKQPLPKVKGKETQRTELRFGDTFHVDGEPVIFEKADKLLPEGAEGAQSHRTLKKKPSKLPVHAGIALCLAGLGWGAMRFMAVEGYREDERAAAVARARELNAEAERLESEAPSTRSAEEQRQREERALRSLDFAREQLDSSRKDEGIRALQKVLRDYPDTAAAIVATVELKSVGGGGSSTTGSTAEFNDILARAEALAAEGKPARAEDLLLQFAMKNDGTLLGDRAKRAAATIVRVAGDRVDDLLRSARAAVEAKDWVTAVDSVNRAVRIAAGDALDRARAERDRVYKLKPRSTVDAPVAPPPDRRPPPGETSKKPPVDRPGPEKDPEDTGPVSRDDEAQELFRSARDAQKANQFGVAERGFYRLLKEFPDAEVVRNYRVEVRQRLADVIKKGKGVAGLFQGQVVLRGRKINLTYEFDNESEAADWEVEHPFMVQQKSEWKVDRGELSGQGAGCWLHRAHFKPGTFSMNFRIRPGVPAQDMGVLLMEPKELMNHLMFTIGNQFFQLGKGSGRYAIPGNVIFVFGKGMWKDTDPDMVGFVYTENSEEPKVKARRWTESEIQVSKDKAKWTLKGKAFSGRTFGDNNYRITGIRPALFVLLSEARFDEIVIEGELDPDWVKAERARVFPPIE